MVVGDVADVVVPGVVVVVVAETVLTGDVLIHQSIFRSSPIQSFTTNYFNT